MAVNKNKWLRWVLVLLVLAGVGIGISRYFSSDDIAKTLRDKLISLVQERSEGLYYLEIGHLNIEAATGSAIIRDIRLGVDSNRYHRLEKRGQLPDAIYHFSLTNLLISEVDMVKLVSTNSVELDAITISDGRLTIRRLKQEKKPQQDSTEVKNEIIKSVRNSFRAIRIDTIHINRVDINYFNRKNQVRQVRQAHVDLYEFAIDSTSGKKPDQIFFSGAMKLSIDSLSLPLSGNRYRLGSGNLVLSVRDSSITTIKDLYLRPAGYQSLESFAGSAERQGDVFRISAGELLLDNFDYIRLLEDSVIAADMVLINEPVLEVFNDKSLSPSTASKKGNYPHQLLARLPFQVSVPVIMVKNGTIQYREKNEKGNATGKVFFEQVNGEMGPLNNEPGQNKSAEARFSAFFMGRSAMEARFYFPGTGDGRFQATASFAPFSATILNEAAVPLGNTRLKSGHIDHLSFDLRGDDEYATGTTKLLYHDLKIEVLKKDPGEGTYRKKGLLSAIANEFILHDNNRPGDKHKDQHRITYRRVETKSMFNLVWKTVFYGVKVNTGVGIKGGDKERVVLH